MPSAVTGVRCMRSPLESPHSSKGLYLKLGVRAMGRVRVRMRLGVRLGVVRTRVRVKLRVMVKVIVMVRAMMRMWDKSQADEPLSTHPWIQRLTTCTGSMYFCPSPRRECPPICPPVTAALELGPTMVCSSSHTLNKRAEGLGLG